jgi:hypothetical protein
MFRAQGPASSWYSSTASPGISASFFASQLREFHIGHGLRISLDGVEHVSKIGALMSSETLTSLDRFDATASIVHHSLADGSTISIQIGEAFPREHLAAESVLTAATVFRRMAPTTPPTRRGRVARNMAGHLPSLEISHNQTN